MKKTKMLAIILVLIFIIPIIYFGFFREKELPRPEIKSHTNMIEPENHNYSFDNPPKFKKEGELSFISEKTDNLISKIDIEIADNDFDRALGLMFRPEMADSLGMLFLFEQEDIQAFWMQNTIISLDIIYVNAKGEIVSIYENTETLSRKSLPSAAPAIYVVEVNGGYCKNHGIKIGDRVEF